MRQEPHPGTGSAQWCCAAREAGEWCDCMGQRSSVQQAGVLEASAAESVGVPLRARAIRHSTAPTRITAGGRAAGPDFTNKMISQVKGVCSGKMTGNEGSWPAAANRLTSAGSDRYMRRHATDLSDFRLWNKRRG